MALPSSLFLDLDSVEAAFFQETHGALPISALYARGLDRTQARKEALGLRLRSISFASCSLALLATAQPQ